MLLQYLLALGKLSTLAQLWPGAQELRIFPVESPGASTVQPGRGGWS